MLNDWGYVHYHMNNNIEPSKFMSLLLECVSLDELRNYTFVIGGRVGPTGKTWLTGALQDMGLNAFELYDTALYSYINFDYTDDKNHYIINHMNKLVTVVLNKPLPKKLTVDEISNMLGYPVEIVGTKNEDK